jgi:MscS family membrane protein
VIALAAKDSVENIFGSLTILFDMPFGIGDWVKIGPDVNGIVEEINLRSTRVRTFDDSVITVPNSNLTKAAVENFGARRQRRINLTLGISHQNELDHVLTFADKLRDYMRTHANIRQDNAYAYVTGLTDAGVSVLVQGYIMTADYEEELRIRQELVEAMARLAAETEVNLGPIHWPMAPAPEKKA